ncbi:contact-dependent growth inhibition system immunity protein [Streptomyces sp. Ac-502]|uniref:contact-dependent growth inhibition system immunity protein n=1 Tax=Streptomyces sp. Ac-502 TaxID=3342801 RepID=UPI0038622DFF
MTATVRELRRKLTGDLTVEDMRLLIRQDVGLAYLLPLAVEALRADPLSEGDMYEGDLLAAVLTRDAEVWSGLPELKREVRSLGMHLLGCPSHHWNRRRQVVTTSLPRGWPCLRW